MNREEYEEFRNELIEDAFDLSDSKSEDYTKGSDDVLANFKEEAEKRNIHPLTALMVYKDKHTSAIDNFVETKGESESEPIRGRIIDDINYSVLLLALIDDLGLNEPEEKEEVTINIGFGSATYPLKYTIRNGLSFSYKELNFDCVQFSENKGYQTLKYHVRSDNLYRDIKNELIERIDSWAGFEVHETTEEFVGYGNFTEVMKSYCITVIEVRIDKDE